MRQVGVLCAAALVAVQENVSKLEDDHKKAKMLAGAWSGYLCILYAIVSDLSLPLLCNIELLNVFLTLLH